MPRYTPQELAHHLKDGLLSFPVTTFTDDLQLDEEAYRTHLNWQARQGVAGLFAAGGTGEGFSLSPEENARVVQLAVEEAGGVVPCSAPPEVPPIRQCATPRVPKPLDVKVSCCCPIPDRM